MQNSDIEKCVKMAASGDNFILERNIPEWLLRKDSCNDIFILDLMGRPWLLHQFDCNSFDQIKERFLW